MKRILRIVPCIALLVVAAGAVAETKTFEFADPKGVNGVVFMIDSELEPIVGMAGGIGGTVEYDPADPGSLTGSITIPVSKISLVNDQMEQHMMGPKWLAAADGMMLEFRFDEVTGVQEDGDAKVLTVKGALSLGPASVEKTVNIAASYLEGAASERGGAKGGDLLVLRSQFEVSRQELGIENESASVGPEIGVFVPIVGYSQ